MPTLNSEQLCLEEEYGQNITFRDEVYFWNDYFNNYNCQLKYIEGPLMHRVSAGMNADFRYLQR